MDDQIKRIEPSIRGGQICWHQGFRKQWRSSKIMVENRKNLTRSCQIWWKSHQI